MGTAVAASREDAAFLTRIEAEVSGQVVNGHHVVQVGAVSGGKVEIHMAGEWRAPRPRTPPVYLLPRPFPGLLDRGAEVAGAAAALLAGEPVGVWGQEGAGKTSLLRALAHGDLTASFPDGVVCLDGRHEHAADVLQTLFDAFHDRDAPFKPTDGQLRHGLAGKRALVLLDDVGLAPAEVGPLLNAAPACVFLLCSQDPVLWGEGHAIRLPGLPLEDALHLVERQLGRALAGGERDAARALCAALDGHPMRLLQAAALAREDGRALAEIARRCAPASAAGDLMALVLPALSDPQRRVLAVLTALGGAPVATEHVAAIAGVPAADEVLAELAGRRLARSGSPYRAVGAQPAIWRGSDLDAVRARALAHFVAASERARGDPGRLLEDWEAVRWLLRWAERSERWREVVRLGRAVDTALVLSGRWGAWEGLLRSVWRAAGAAGDRAGEAWALHQLGTRALCLGNHATARADLTDALRLRESLGDRAGAALTRHNLGFLPPPTGGEPVRDPTRPVAGPARIERAGRRPGWLGRVAAALVLGLALSGAGYLALGGEDDEDDRGDGVNEIATRGPTRAPTRAPTRLSTRVPTEPPVETAAPPTSTDTPELATDTPEPATDTPEPPGDVSVSLVVGEPSTLADGWISVPFTASSDEVGDVGEYEFLVGAWALGEEGEPQVTVSATDLALLLDPSWAGAAILLRAAVDACPGDGTNPNDCPLPDADPGNNLAEQQVVLPNELPDLVPVTCDRGDLGITVVVENRGKGPAGATTTRVESVSGIPASAAMGPIPRGGSASVSMESPGSHPYDIFVDASGEVDEADESNNTLSANCFVGPE